MTINCIIIEDEKPALDLMVDNVGKIPFLNLVGCCRNTFEANEFLLKEKVDLIFSDIEMPTVSGLQFLKTLRNPPMVILTTAYEQYAMEGYELDVIDYLMKPFFFDRFLKAVNKAQQQYIFRNQSTIESDDEGFLFVFSEYKEIKIAYKDIYYIEGLKDYVKIYLENHNRPILTRLNLKAMEARLPMPRFFRIHNSYIVPLSKINSVQKTKVHLGNKVIPVGTAFSVAFLEVYKSTP
ncbi:MAG: LytTR family DNA-binding domain-containing protein [Fulvivirga sp.]